MSYYYGAPAAMGGIIGSGDNRLLDEAYDDECFMPPVILDLQLQEEQLYGQGWVVPWWPSPESLYGDGDGVSGMGVLHAIGYWVQPYPVSGSNARLAVIGYTRDATGAAVGSATVRLFLTSTGEMVDSTTSGTDGAYTLRSPYSAAHFVTVHKAGPPDIAGATVDSITPG